MGFFDRLFGKRKGGKIKIKFFSEKDKKDEQEQFLITVGDDAFEQKKQVQRGKAVVTTEKNATGSMTAKADDELQVSVQNKKAYSRDAASVQSNSKKSVSDTVNRKKAVPISSVDEAPEEAGSVTVTEGKATRNGKFDIKRAKDGRYFFNLYASNYAVIAYSQIYSSSAAAMNGIKSIIANAGKTPIEDTTLKSPKSYPFPKWEIYIDKAGEYRFRLYATNGLQICHSSHGYSTKSGCKGGIDSITRFASDAAKIDKTYLKKD